MRDRERANAAVPARTGTGTGRRLRGAVAQVLGTQIVSGAILPGQLLAGEVENAGILNVSRSAYREAVQVLTAKSLVESRPKVGTRVLPRERWNILDPQVLAWAFSGEPDVTFVRDLFELRAIVEPAAAALAAERRSEEERDAMRDAVARMRLHSLANEDGRAADRDFHDALLRASHNSAIMALSASIGAAVAWTTRYKQRSRSLPRDPVPDHARVCDAIVAADGAAAHAAMRQLVELALADTQSAMATAGRPA